MIEITEKKLRELTGEFVVDFYAEWCGHCRQLKPYLDKAEKEFPDIPFYASDVDSLSQDCVEWFLIDELPYVVYCNKGFTATYSEDEGDFVEWLRRVRQ